MIYRREGNMKVVWALIAVMAVCQLAFAFELMEMSSLVKRVASVDLQTAMIKNEAAAKDLETERIRNVYYRAVTLSPMKLTEEQCREIIKEGAKFNEEEE